MVEVTVVVAVLLGLFVCMRRENQAELAAEKRRTEEARAEKTVMEERNRIARDLHDVVAHHITGIAVQAEAAPLPAGGGAAASTTEFSTIRQTALSTLDEMRGVLGRLRDDQETPFAPAIRDLFGLPGSFGHWKNRGILLNSTSPEAKCQVVSSR